MLTCATNFLKSAVTPNGQLNFHNAANIATGATGALIGSAALVDNKDPTLLIFGCAMFAVSAIGSALHHTCLFRFDPNLQQFVSSLTNVAVGIAEAILANEHEDPTLMAFAWTNVAVGTAGLGVQAVREFECLPAPASSDEAALE